MSSAAMPVILEPRSRSATPAIEIRGLSKRFGRVEVLRGIDLDIAPGRVTAVVGPNGAGKTTLIKSIIGLVHATGGTIRVGGASVIDGDDYRARIGYMPQIARFPHNLSGTELLAMLKDLRRSAAPDSEVDEKLIALFHLGDELTKPLRALSGGTRQKVNAVAAFLFHPELLILDEPTAGLDPLSSSVLKDKIAEERRAGRTVVITSHVMSDLQELADDLIVLLDGWVRYAGTVSHLLDSMRQRTLERAIARLMIGDDVQLGVASCIR
ncbi:MAG: ABC transporter ATP-binding protein [Gemmatimonadota bacterium]|nr:ABC transporter ATP-binding protein [Gemmatimonadota bacterium]